MQQFIRKNFIQPILLKPIQNSADACIIMEQTFIYLFVNGTEIDKFKAKDSEFVVTPLCLGNILRDFSVDNIKKNRIKWICF